MLNSLPGKKIGMTQFFSKNGDVVPVTVIDMKNWVVTQVKTLERDGYSSVQVGLLRKRYQGVAFASEWVKAKGKYFLDITEMPFVDQEFVIGQQITLDQMTFDEKQIVSVSGRSIGKGFQGVMKRWGFKGGPKSHGSTFHRKPGALSHMRRQGEVIKGKKLPGHDGNRMVTTRGLAVVHIDQENQCLLVKGAVPGKQATIVMVKKQEAK